MAKRRRSSVRRRKKKKKGGRESSWKKSKPVAVALIVAIIGLWIRMFFFGGASQDPILKQIRKLPRFYISAKDGKVIAVDGGRPFPFRESKKIFWEAYICSYEKCPGRGKDDKAYIFPYVIRGVTVGSDGKPKYPHVEGPDGMMDPMMDAFPKCPKCAKLKKSDKLMLEEYVTPYLTDEVKKKKAELWQEYKKKHKKKG